MPAKIRAKAQLRREIRRTLRSLSNEKVADDSRLLRQKLLFPKGAQVALFAGTAIEPMVLNLISENHEINWFLPKVTGPGEMQFIQVTDACSFRVGPFGILEPVAGKKADSLDYIVCPGLAFTMAGKRLGQGGGFYDRALPRFAGAKVLGVAFSCQILDDLPSEEHDQEMDLVLTPFLEAPDGIPEC